MAQCPTRSPARYSPPRRLGTSNDTRVCGRVELIIGPMFAGKTSELLRRLRRYEVANQRVKVINHVSDNRYSDASEAVTHDKVRMKADALENLSEADVSEYDVIGVDEGQFFGTALAQNVDAWSRAGKVVIVAMLDSTFERKAFPGLLEMVVRADYVEKLTAVCQLCNAEASFSLRLGHSKMLFEVGAASDYKAVCFTCHEANSNLANASE